MNTIVAVTSAAFIAVIVCAATYALLMPSEHTHRIWAARVAQIRAIRAARSSTRAQARAARAQARAQARSARAEAAWREVFRG